MLGVAPSSPTNRSIQGVPVQWSPAVDEDVIWGIPQAKVFVVLRLPASIVTDRSAYFSSDGVGIRAVLRVGFAFPHEQAVIKISVGASRLHTTCPPATGRAPNGAESFDLGAAGTPPRRRPSGQSIRWARRAVYACDPFARAK